MPFFSFQSIMLHLFELNECDSTVLFTNLKYLRASIARSVFLGEILCLFNFSIESLFFLTPE